MEEVGLLRREVDRVGPEEVEAGEEGHEVPCDPEDKGALLAVEDVDPHLHQTLEVGEEAEICVMSSRMVGHLIVVK